MSVFEMNKSGKGVWFNGDQSYIMDLKTGRTEYFKYDGNGFTMNMWMKDVDMIHREEKPIDFIGQEIYDL